jgi:Skp family chaperone for outer membrane proteins
MKNIAIAVILVLGTLAISANIENQTKIGVIDYKWLISQTDDGKNMDKKLASFRRTHEEEIRKSEAVLAEKNAWLSSPEVSKKAEDSDINAASAEIEQLREHVELSKEKFEKELEKLRETLETPIKEKLQTVIEDIAAKNGYKYVINKTDSNGEDIVVVGAQESDITEQVSIQFGIGAGLYKGVGNN